MRTYFKRFLSAILIFCLLLTTAFAEEHDKNVLESIGDWFSQAWDDSSKWVSQAWDDSSKWVSQAWEDSSKWVDQAWKDSTTWATGNWSSFVIWVQTITYDNPYSWIRDMVLEEGILAYDEFVMIRTFMAQNPDTGAINNKLFELLSELSLLNEDKNTLWEMLSDWAKAHKITADQAALLSIPFIERLNIKGEEALGENAEFSGSVIAQYLITLLEAMNIKSYEDGETRLNALRSSLDNLTRPIVIGEQDQNIVITEDHCYIENFTYSKGKYQIFMLVSPIKGGDSESHQFRGKTTEQLITQYFQDAEFNSPIEEKSIGSYDSQAMRFDTHISDKIIYGKAVRVFTEKNEYLFFILTDQEWKDAEYNTWVSSVKMSEEEKVSFEVDFDSDGAFYGINQAAQKYTINRYFDEAKFSVPKTGHGWAAERGNNLIDNVKGFFKREHSTVIGDNNVKNGADRRTVKKIDGMEQVVELIQTKYYSTAARTVNACFDETGYRYIDANGNPMSLEVPSNQYETAIKLMEKRIQNGEVRNVDPSDIEMAKKIVKKGSLSYQQAKHLAKAGTIESLLYDSVHACVYSASAIGISAVVEFAFSLWNGDSMETAIQNSIYSGLRTGGITFIVSVISSQLLKTSLNSALVPASDALVRALGPKVAAAIVNAFRPAGSAIYGAAAMKAASKFLRGNIVTAAITFAVLTSIDVAELIQGRISWKQMAKNTASTAAGIAGGAAAGIAMHTLIGTSLFPGAGTIAGIIVGTVVAIGASEGTKALTNLIAEDDAEDMIKIINEQFAIVAEEYFLNEVEVNRSIENLQGLLSQEMLKQMYQYGNHKAFARQLIEMSIDPVVMDRQYISLPPEDEYSEILTETLNEIYAEIGDEPAA